MKKISWIQISTRKYGGNIYTEQVSQILAENFDFEIKSIEAKNFKWRYLKPLEWLWNFTKLSGRSDLWVRDSFIATAAQFLNKTKGRELALVYHIDNSIFPVFWKPILFLLEKFFYRNLKKASAIVTISEYWEKYFKNRGYKNVYKIYNGFNLSDFEVSEEEIKNFKKKFGLEGKPIIYIGSCQKAKGVVEIYQALKDLEVHLITSGEEMVKIPARNLNLAYGEYLKLLNASTIVIEMHKFKTGWSRISHEAMLFKKPVIGSGLGGTRELLEKGNQIICENFKDLKKKVMYLLDNSEKRKKMGEDGYQYAKNFTMERFEKEWIDLIKKIIE